MQNNKETEKEKNIVKNSFSLIIVASLLDPCRGSFKAGFKVPINYSSL